MLRISYQSIEKNCEQIGKRSLILSSTLELWGRHKEPTIDVPYRWILEELVSSKRQHNYLDESLTRSTCVSRFQLSNVMCLMTVVRLHIYIYHLPKPLEYMCLTILSIPRQDHDSACTSFPLSGHITEHSLHLCFVNISDLPSRALWLHKT